MTKLLTLVLTISLALAGPSAPGADRDGFNEQ
jgi:hypothetical protein